MNTLVIIGAQWGDEGKGKIVHFLGKYADYVVRYQGGPNAGHTIIIDGKPFVLHTIPSGMVLPGKICLVANGVVFDPESLYEEVSLLKKKKYSIRGRLFISPAAHVILPYHKLLDELREKGHIRIGTTRRGIGPAYADKVVRIGIRLCDFVEEKTFRNLLELNIKEKMPVLKQITTAPKLRAMVMKNYSRWRNFLKPLMADTALMLEQAAAKNKNILFESAQGTMLDIDFGTYPFVTSSSPISGGVCIGAGFPPTKLKYVLGVIKAYCTRVGEGPFPTELKDKMGDYLREKGLEYAVAVRHSVRINGIDSLAVTKLDCLKGINPLKICVAYNYKGRIIREFPYSREVQANCKPVYIEMPGFNEGIRNTEFSQIPANARKYIMKLEELTKTKVSLVSMGRTREETIVVSKPNPSYEEKWGLI